MRKEKFRTSSKHVLDVKGRLSIPSRFKDVIRQFDSDKLAVYVWPFGVTHLRIYPLEAWEELEQKVRNAKMSNYNKEMLTRHMSSEVDICTMDKQGRILISAKQQQAASVDKEVVLTGMLDWVEVWGAAAWIKENPGSLEDLDSMREELAELDIF